MISFIIPAYNAESFIDSCLQSIVNQTYHDYEIIIINDGSTDNTRAILEEYCHNYRNLDISVFHIKNGGHGNARNFGVSKAKREYIWFIDADDILYSNTVVEDAVVDLKNEYPDIYIFSVYETDYKNRNIYWHYSKQDMLTNIYKTPSLVFRQNWVWNKPIRRQFLLESKIKFLEFRMFEDIYFFCSLYPLAQKIYITRDIKYVYIKHDESLTSSIKNYVSYPKALFHEVLTYFKLIFSKER